MPVPEPSSLLLLGSGVLGFASVLPRGSADSLEVDPGRDVSRLAADMPGAAAFIVLVTILAIPPGYGLQAPAWRLGELRHHKRRCSQCPVGSSQQENRTSYLPDISMHCNYIHSAYNQQHVG